MTWMFSVWRLCEQRQTGKIKRLQESRNTPHNMTHDSIERDRKRERKRERDHKVYTWCLNISFDCIGLAGAIACIMVCSALLAQKQLIQMYKSTEKNTNNNSTNSSGNETQKIQTIYLSFLHSSSAYIHSYTIHWSDWACCRFILRMFILFAVSLMFFCLLSIGNGFLSISKRHIAEAHIFCSVLLSSHSVDSQFLYIALTTIYLLVVAPL